VLIFHQNTFNLYFTLILAFGRQLFLTVAELFSLMNVCSDLRTHTSVCSTMVFFYTVLSRVPIQACKLAVFS